MSDSLTSLLKSIGNDDWIATEFELYLAKEEADDDDRDRTKLHISAVSYQCPRDIYYEFICPEKREPPSHIERLRFLRGKALHDAFQTHYLRAGILLAKEIYVDINEYLIGSTDGELKTLELWELKTTNPRNYSKVCREGVPDYVLNQIILYLFGLDKEKGVVEYCDASEMGTARFDVYANTKRAKELIAQAEQIWGYIQSKKLPPIVTTNKCKWCKSRKICGRK